MKPQKPPVLILCLLLGLPPSVPAAEEPSPARRAASILALLTETFAAPAWREVKCSSPRRIEQNPGQIYNSGLAPVWMVDVTAPSGRTGYFMWEDTGTFPLVDFAWDAPEAECLPNPGRGALLRNIPNQQQFPVPGTSAPEVASGCVPTAAANLVAFWAEKGVSRWWGSQGTSGPPPDLPSLTRRLRKRLRMQEIADADGFTDSAMPLSGAFPTDLMECLRQDAADFGIPLETSLQRFSSSALKQETGQGRPVLLSCLVRLPQKPHLSWGHEVTGTGWVEIAGSFFAGVRDNFLPSRSGQTTRWIAEGQMQSLLRVAPKTEPIRSE